MTDIAAKNSPSGSENVDDAGLEKKLRDYHCKGGSAADTDEAKSLEGEIALTHLKHEERLEKGRPQQSKTAQR